MLPADFFVEPVIPADVRPFQRVSDHKVHVGPLPVEIAFHFRKSLNL